MDQIVFDTYKIANKISLGNIASFFKLQNPSSWKEHIRIDGPQLETVLKYSSKDKSVYIFKFGCISFVNFVQHEIYTFLEYLKSLAVNIDYSMFTRLNENHIIRMFDDGTCCPWRNSDKRVEYSGYINDIVSIILAKSTELYNIEIELDRVLDEAEKFIIYLQRARLSSRPKKTALTPAKIIKFKYQGLESIKVFERPFEVDKTVQSRQVYDETAKYYELEDRYEIIKSQMDNLESITQSYSRLAYNRTESRLLWLEVFLLVLFPVFHILNHFTDVKTMLDTFGFFK